MRSQLYTYLSHKHIKRLKSSEDAVELNRGGLVGGGVWPLQRRRARWRTTFSRKNDHDNTAPEVVLVQHDLPRRSCTHDRPLKWRKARVRVY